MAPPLESSALPATTLGLAARTAQLLRQTSGPARTPAGGSGANNTTFDSLLAGQTPDPVLNQDTSSRTDAPVSIAAPATSQRAGYSAAAADLFPEMLPGAARVPGVAPSPTVSLSPLVDRGADTATAHSGLPHRGQEQQPVDAAPAAAPLVEVSGCFAPPPVQVSPTVPFEAPRAPVAPNTSPLPKAAPGVSLVPATSTGLVPAAEAAAAPAIAMPAPIDGVTILRQERHLAAPVASPAAQPHVSDVPAPVPVLTSSGVEQPGQVNPDAGTGVQALKPLALPTAGGSQIAASDGDAATKSASNGLTRAGFATVISGWSTFSKPQQGSTAQAPSPGEIGVSDPSASQISSGAAPASFAALPAFQQVVAAVKDQIEAHRAAPANSGAAGPTSQAAVSDPVQVLVVRLHPEELGEVKVRLTLAEGSISVRVEAQQRSAAEALQMQRNELVEGLKGSGYSVGGISIHEAAGTASAQGPSSGSSSDRWVAAGQGTATGPGGSNGGMTGGSSDSSPRGGQSNRSPQNAQQAAVGQPMAVEAGTPAKSGVFL